MTVLAALAAVLTFGTAASAATSPAPAGQVAAFVAQPAVVAPTVAAPVAATTTPTSYRVVPGDTLSGIAARFCGRASAYPALAAASGIRDPNWIYPGDVVTLACAGGAGVARAASPAPAPPPVSSDRAAAVVAFAEAQVGKSYVWAAAGPNAYDCSGLVLAAYARVGIRLPHQSEAMLAYGRPVSRADLRPGDVVWPYTGHVFIYVGQGRIVEAATPSQGVRYNTLYAFMTARRLV